MILGLLIALTVYFNIAHTEHLRKFIGQSATETTSTDANEDTGNINGTVQEVKTNDKPDQPESKPDVKEEVHVDSKSEEKKSEPDYPEAYFCYHKYLSDLTNVELLDDIILSKRQPTPDKSIFFVISSCFKDNRIEIRKR